MKKIVITGGEGIIGTILRKGLAKDYEITSLDLPDGDVRDYDILSKAIEGHDAIIHLAWDVHAENWKSGMICLDNIQMMWNVYKAAVEKGVPRVIMASSVHADSFIDLKPEDMIKKLSPFSSKASGSPYGATKLYIEAMGKYFALHHLLKVIAIRFGGVNSEDSVVMPSEPTYHQVWLSHRDCVSLIKQSLESELPKEMPFTTVYGISNNTGSIHDTENIFNWEPKDNGSDRL